MGVDISHYRQQQENTCALACLRMVLAAYGTQVTEREIEAQTRLVERGVHIAELERLTHRYKPVAEVRETTISDLRHLVEQGKLPIAYIDRSVFDLTPRQREKHSIRAE
jgi:ABC-type bacteriocin/lantibiotic exporter with double-glycine peptidase domain